MQKKHKLEIAEKSTKGETKKVQQKQRKKEDEKVFARLKTAIFLTTRECQTKNSSLHRHLQPKIINRMDITALMGFIASQRLSCLKWHFSVLTSYIKSFMD